MKEDEFLKELESRGLKEEQIKLQIYYMVDDKGNVKIDWDSIGEDFKRAEQELLSIEESLGVKNA